MKKLIIFDFDGVVVDTEPFYVEIHLSFFEKLGVPFTAQGVRNMAGRSLISIFREIKETFNLPQSPEELKQMNVDHMIEFFQKTEIPLIAGIPTLLNFCKEKGIAYCLASSNSKKVINAVLVKTKLTSYFDVLVCGDDVYEGKPNPEIFQLAAKKMGYVAEDCLVIEDTTNGVKAAHNAGMYCIGFSNPSSGNQDLSLASEIITGRLDQLTSRWD